MSEYIIQGETLTRMADIIRSKFRHYDISLALITDKISVYEIPFPEGITSIGAGAFANCTNLITINVPWLKMLQLMHLGELLMQL